MWQSLVSKRWICLTGVKFRASEWGARLLTILYIVVTFCWYRRSPRGCHLRSFLRPIYLGSKKRHKMAAPGGSTVPSLPRQLYPALYVKKLSLLAESKLTLLKYS